LASKVVPGAAAKLKKSTSGSSGGVSRLPCYEKAIAVERADILRRAAVSLGSVSSACAKARDDGPPARHNVSAK